MNKIIYKPYNGGAGPSEKQVHNNNLALKEKLIAKGFKAELTYIDEGDEKIETVKCNNRSAGYDRWGFCSDSDCILDQASLEKTIEYFLEIVKCY